MLLLVTTFMQTGGLQLSRAQPCSPVSSLSHSTFLFDDQSSTDKKTLKNAGPPDIAELR